MRTVKRAPLTRRRSGKLAAATADRVVHLYDEAGERRDKFRTKAADGNSSGAYLIRGLAFSPDSSKLAVAQSDNIVFVYRLGAGWDEKKSICNKFLQSSAVACLAWPAERHGDVCFGLADGKVKLGVLKTNKTYTLYAHPSGSPVAALAASPDGRALVSGHADGSLYQFTFPEQQDGSGGTAGCVKLVHHSCAPCALAWGESVVAAGSDCRVVFYDPKTGREQAAFDQGGDNGARSFGCAAMNPAGDAAVVGGFNRLYIFARGGPKGLWQPAGVKQIDNMFAVTAASWKPDGSKLAVGGLRGNVDIWDACIRRTKHKGKFELTYVSKKAVIVKTLATGSRIVLKSVYGYEVSKVSVYQGRYIVGRTHATLLLGDLESCQLSEVPWEGGGGGERFYFENEQVCLLYSAGELHVVEYGINDTVLALRTEHISPYLLSVAVQEARGAMPAAKRVAYLVDATTLRVVDFTAAAAAAAAGGVTGGGGAVLATVSHDARIDWLELNQRGSHLLFRDKGRRLLLLDLATQERTPLLGFCQYVQWVPGSDCVVAQSRGELCVWYGVGAPGRPTVIPIRGDVSGIERAPGRTEVLVDEGLTQAAYALDEGLIDFGAALEFLDFDRAVSTLEALPPSTEVEAQWRALGALALQHEVLWVAERCAAALGEVARVRFLHKLIKQAERRQQEQPAAGQGGGAAGELPVEVKAQLAVLAQQWPVAESLLLAQGRVDDTIAAYRDAHRWEDAIRVADTSRHPGSDDLRAAHFKWLLSTGQEDKAGAGKEREGDLAAAIALYLKGGAPARAAQAVVAHPGIAFDPALLAAVAAALTKAGLHERAGDLAAALGRPLDALAAYRKGGAYRKAVELARGAAPAQVIVLEEEWGDWLASQRQMDAAINHFIEAGVAAKAIEAALAARQFPKAAGIIEHLDASQAAPFFKRIAQHYAANGGLAEAEGYWLKAGLPLEAVEMYTRAGKWEAAQKVARGYLPEGELRRFNAQRAKEAEAAKNWKEAERGYLAAGEAEAAIGMYKRNRMWEPMIRLVGQHRRENLPESHLLAAQALQLEGHWREAERHFTDAKDWKAAVAMYTSQGSWEDALRVAKAHGGAAATKQVAYAWAVAVPPEEGGALLRRLGLGDAAVDAAAEAGAFGHAFQLAQVAAPQRMADVHLKHAMYLEDNGRFNEAEVEFVNAGKPREAIDMYIHAQDWEAALRVAEGHEPESVGDVLAAQAQALADSGQLSAAESVFLKARRPEAALQMYRAASQWAAALRVAEAYAPARVAGLHLEMAAAMAQQGQGGAGGGVAAAVARAQAFERGNDYARAVEAYLSPSAEGAAAADVDVLQRCWEAGLALAARHQRHRVGDVAAAVAARLVGAGRVGAAVDVLEGVGDVQGAAEAAVSGSLFDRARALAAGNPQLLRLVDERHTAALVAANDADELAARGNVAAAVEMYAAQGNWERAHELAAQDGPELAAATAARHAQLLLRQGDAAAAAAALARRGVGAADADVLRQVLQQLELAATTRKRDSEEFSRLFWAAHHVSCASRSKAAGLSELAARQLTAALRYVGVLPADRAFFEAGAAWRAAGRPSMAFVLLNRYLDIEDAADEAGGGGGAQLPLEGADFVGTDIPRDAPLPAHHYCDERTREENPS
ncbi:Intraflagellar transport protein [Monoraphidium neglectum]|uniref:Intraflagellar transport protein n=1 Tax=Monoraphidium neglectum TaxID=145388 RepID=A0A0D2MYX0_9CHLO|nr:Intraflagellar transport protein [Monoraphidium neglectum]KIZ07625.1 Intraflagellar transport protein [Monoraphidium neglectum]|eukprot:XP_013906644.1 Intraflagellar transport protein [Monoraphidium neglectum]